MPDDNNGISGIISVETFELRVIEQIKFCLGFKRSLDIYSGVAEEIFFSSDRYVMIQRQIVQEIENFVREIWLLRSGIFYFQNNSGIKSVEKIPARIEEVMKISIVDVAAQKDYIFLILMVQ